MSGADVASGTRAFENELTLSGRQVDGLDRRSIVVVRAGKRADREEHLSTWQCRWPPMRALAFLVVERRDSTRLASGRAHLKQWTSRHRRIDECVVGHPCDATGVDVAASLNHRRHD